MMSAKFSFFVTLLTFAEAAVGYLLARPRVRICSKKTALAVSGLQREMGQMEQFQRMFKSRDCPFKHKMRQMRHYKKGCLFLLDGEYVLTYT